MAAKSLRAVGLAITLVSAVTLFTFAYSGVVDFQTFVGSLHSGQAGSAINGSAMLQGSNLLLDLNVTAQNVGLYPVLIGLTCSPMQPDDATCKSAQAVIAPGEKSTLVFRMTVPNGAEYFHGKKLHINGTVTVGLEPFGSISIGRDFGDLFVLESG